MNSPSRFVTLVGFERVAGGIVYDGEWRRIIADRKHRPNNTKETGTARYGFARLSRADRVTCEATLMETDIASS